MLSLNLFFIIFSLPKYIIITFLNLFVIIKEKLINFKNIKNFIFSKNISIFYVWLALDAYTKVLELDPEDGTTQNFVLNLQIFLDKKKDNALCCGLCSCYDKNVTAQSLPSPPPLQRGASEFHPRMSGKWN